MKCPIDNETLVIADRNGVEIDYCPKCRGVWLDRGELDKIIDRSTPAQVSSPPPPPSREAPRKNDEGYRRYSDDDDDHHHGKPKKRESWLGDLFDF